MAAVIIQGLIMHTIALSFLMHAFGVYLLCANGNSECSRDYESVLSCEQDTDMRFSSETRFLLAANSTRTLLCVRDKGTLPWQLILAPKQL